MAYKVALTSVGGGSNYGKEANLITEKDYTNKIASYIKKRLDTLGIENFLVSNSDEDLSDDEKINRIKAKYGTGNNIIVISNRLNSGGASGIEIMYALRNNSRLSNLISNNLTNANQNITKYYQLRNSNNTALDDDYLIRNTKNNQTIVIDYGYIDNAKDALNIKNNYEDMAEAVVKAVANYVGVTYVPLSKEGYYIVQKGDSLWSIASKNGISVSDLKQINNLTSNLLSIGQVLKVVKDGSNLSNNILNYTVKSGDSLWSIANKFSTTVDKIKEANGLSSNLLSIGQVLTIPSSEAYKNYTVVKGDTLYAIASKFNTTVTNLKKLNNLSSNTLTIGKVLLIPA